MQTPFLLAKVKKLHKDSRIYGDLPDINDE